MKRFAKAIPGLLIIIIPAVIMLGLLFNKLSQKSFYPLSGTFSVSGIHSSVKIYSDDYGVPHIFAEGEHDLYFTFGYLHARDRLWQMDISRRVAEGRLSEIFGNKTADFDKLFRTIGINRLSSRLYNNLSEHSKFLLKSYSEGINRFIEAHQDNLPVEFDALNYSPDLWKAEHSLMIGRLMGWDLNLTWFADYVMAEILEKTGLEKTSEMFPDSSLNIYYKTVKTESDTSELSQDNFSSAFNLVKNFAEINKTYRKFFNIDCSHTGSNCWVVSGNKSESGKPVLANDPHLPFQAPSRWYEIHLRTDSIDVYGMSVPGIPAVLIGHNNNIAWGLTNLMNDDNDFVLLRQDSAVSGSYFYNNQKFLLDTLIEKIIIKDSAEMEFPVINSHLGPVISKLNLMGSSEKDKEEIVSSENKLLTFRWTGYEISDDIDAFYKINRAANWEQFKFGLRGFCVPAQNIIYADIQGNIGYHAAGKIPLRKSSHVNNFIFPASEENEWTGFAEFDNLPSLYNPKEGFIVTANTNPFDMPGAEKNRFYISWIYESSSRYDKINGYLSGRSKVGVNDFRLLQLSYDSPYASEISKYLIDAFKNSFLTDFEKVYLNKFESWNGEMKPNEETGTVYNLFYIMLLKNTYEDELGINILRDLFVVQNIPYRSILLMLRNNSSWFDNINSPEKETKNEIIRKSFSDALALLGKLSPEKPHSEKSWGKYHLAVFRHPFGNIPALEESFNIGPFETGGDQTTVNNGEYSFFTALETGSFENNLGPSMRMITDLSDIRHSLTINTTGQNGQPLHPNYKDQSHLWLYGDFKKGTMNESEMKEKNFKLLLLNPY